MGRFSLTPSSEPAAPPLSTCSPSQTLDGDGPPSEDPLSDDPPSPLSSLTPSPEPATIPLPVPGPPRLDSSNRKSSSGARRSKKRYKSELRRRNRLKERHDRNALQYVPPSYIADAHGEPPAVGCSTSARQFTRADGAWIGKRTCADVDEHSRAVEDMVASGFKYIPFDARYVITIVQVIHSTNFTFSAPLLLTDRNQQVVAIFAGFPVEDKTWGECVDGVQAAINTLGKELRFGANRCLPKPSNGSGENRRGGFKTVAVGISFGGGQTVSCGNTSLCRY